MLIYLGFPVDSHRLAALLAGRLGIGATLALGGYSRGMSRHVVLLLLLVQLVSSLQRVHQQRAG